MKKPKDPDKPYRKPRRVSENERQRRRERMLKARESLPEARKNPLADPKKVKWLENYYNPESEFYANAYASAIDAGFSHSYAKSIKSPAVNNKWTQLENYYNAKNMTPDHIIKSFERIALQSPKEENQMRALEMLAKFKGMLIEKKHVVTQNIETLLNDDEEPKDETDVIDL